MRGDVAVRYVYPWAMRPMVLLWWQCSVRGRLRSFSSTLYMYSPCSVKLQQEA